MATLDANDPIRQLSTQIQPLLCGNDYGTVTAALASLLGASLILFVRESGHEPPEIAVLLSLLREICNGIIDARNIPVRES